jgi:chemotaxis protein MotB
MSSSIRGARAGQDRWLVSYADIMTLLFALFTTMYAAAAVDATKAELVGEPIEQPVAVRAGADAARPPMMPSIVPPVELVPREDTLESIRARLAVELEQEIKLQRAEISRDGRGLVISLPEQATFRTGSADVTPEARQLIVRVAAAVAPLPNPIRIEGHTDDVPIRTSRYASNWELSTARAAAVVTLLISGDHVQPERLSAAGYGEFHPRAANDSAENRARNRRIDLVIADAASSFVLRASAQNEMPEGVAP